MLCEASHTAVYGFMKASVLSWIQPEGVRFGGDFDFIRVSSCSTFNRTEHPSLGEDRLPGSCLLHILQRLKIVFTLQHVSIARCNYTCMLQRLKMIMQAPCTLHESMKKDRGIALELRL